MASAAPTIGVAQVDNLVAALLDHRAHMLRTGDQTVWNDTGRAAALAAHDLFEHRTIANERDRADFIKRVEAVKLPATFEWRLGRDRSLDQNSLQFLWANEAADQRGDMTADEVRCEWKLRHGVPIMREASEEFRAIYDAALKPLPYNMKLQAIRFIDVTSKMKVPQMIRYLDTIQRECAEQGIRLTDPDGDLASYQARYRSDAV